MRTLVYRIKLLSQRTQAIANLLAKQRSKKVGRIEAGASGSVAWLTVELAITMGLLKEAVRTLDYFWPDGSEWADEIVRRVDTDTANLPVSNGDEVHAEFMLRVGATRYDQDEPLDVEVLFEKLSEWRRLCAALRATSIAQDSWGELLTLQADYLENRVKRLEGEDTAKLREALRCLLAEEWLYPGIQAGNASPADRHYLWFGDYIRQTQRGSPMRIGSLQRELRETYDINGAWADVLYPLMTRIEEMILSDGYEGLFDILGAEGNLLGESGGAEPRYNLIPSEKRGPCREILLAFARPGRSAAKTGAVATLRAVRGHLIKCQGKTRVVLFFAPLEDIAKALADSASDLEAHVDAGALQVFIPIAVYKNRLSVIAWRD